MNLCFCIGIENMLGKVPSNLQTITTKQKKFFLNKAESQRSLVFLGEKKKKKTSQPGRWPER
jgi:hypothetical protein